MKASTMMRSFLIRDILSNDEDDDEEVDVDVDEVDVVGEHNRRQELRAQARSAHKYTPAPAHRSSSSSSATTALDASSTSAANHSSLSSVAINHNNNNNINNNNIDATQELPLRLDQHNRRRSKSRDEESRSPASIDLDIGAGDAGSVDGQQQQQQQQRQQYQMNSPLEALFQMTSSTFDALKRTEKRKDRDSEHNGSGTTVSGKQTTKKKRKSRTAFTNHQIYELERRFRMQKYLSPTDRDEIALSLSLSNAQVITWFQNRRAKLKRDLEEQKRDIETAALLNLHKTFLESFQALTQSQMKTAIQPTETLCGSMTEGAVETDDSGEVWVDNNNSNTTKRIKGERERD